MLSAAVSSRKSKKSSTNCSDRLSIYTSDITFKSAKSNKSSIPDDENFPPTVVPDDLLQTSPNLQDFIDMSSKGELDFSDTFMKELYAINSRLDTACKVSSEIQQRWCELEHKVNVCEKSLTKLREDLKIEFNHVKQYQMIDNLLFHKFILPTATMSSLEFSQYDRFW